MRLSILRSFEWSSDTSFGKGQIVIVDDVELARAWCKLGMAAPADDAARWVIDRAGEQATASTPTANTARAAEIMRELKGRCQTGAVIETTFRR